MQRRGLGLGRSETSAGKIIGLQGHWLASAYSSGDHYGRHMHCCHGGHTACRAENPGRSSLHSAGCRLVRHLLLFLCVITAPRECPGQHAGHQVDLPVLIDGAKNPERIPDGLALQHFLLALTVAANASQMELNRQEAQLGSLEIPSDERIVMKRELQLFRRGWEALERKWDISNPQMRPEEQSGAVAELRKARGELSDSTMARIRSLLSAQTAGRLDRHIQTRVKSRIIIYGSAN